jgi:CHAT domain-containing protein
MKTIGLVFLSFFTLTSAFSQQSLSPLALENYYKKIERMYEKGDYKPGFKNNLELIKKLSTSNNKFEITSAHFLAARGGDLMGKFDNYKYHVTTAEKLFDAIDSTNIKAYAKTVLYAVDAYTSYGDYKKAGIYLDKIQRALMKETSFSDSALTFELQERQARVYFNQGFHLKAQRILPTVIAYRKNKISKYDLVFDKKKNKLVKVKLNNQERTLRKRRYALLKELEAQIVFENGDYPTAMSLTQQNEAWIRKNISKKDIAYVNNQFVQGLFNQTQEEFDDANKLFVKAEKLIKRTKYGRYRSYSREAMEINEYMVSSYSYTRHVTKYSKRRRLLEKKVKKYYGKDNYYYGRVMMLTARKNLYLENWTKAAETMNKLLQQYTMFPEDHLERSLILTDLSDAQLELNKFKEAQLSLEGSAYIKKVMLGETAPLYHMAKLYLADFYVEHSDNFAEAEEIYKKSLWQVVSKEINHKHQSYQTFLEEEISLYQITDKFDEAYTKAKNMVEEANVNFGNMSEEYAAALVKFSDVSIDVGKYSDAEANLALALKLIDAVGNANETLIYALETMSRLYVILGYFDQAEKMLNKSFKLSKKTSNEDKLAIAIEERALLYINTGRHSEMEEKLKSVIDTKQKRLGKENRTLVKPINYLAYLYYVMGDYGNAEKSLIPAMAISKKVFGEKSLRYSESMHIQALVYQAMGDYERALDLEQQVYDIQVKQLGKKHINVANTLNELALLKFYNKEENIKVETLFKQSLEVIDENLGKNNLLYAEVLKNLSLFYLGTNETDKADVSIDNAYKVWIEKYGDQNQHIAEYYYIKGGIDVAKKDFINANNDYISAKNLYLVVFNNKHPDYIKALGKSAQMQYVLGDYKNAIDFANETVTSYLAFIANQFPSLSEREKTKSWNIMRTDFEFYYSMALSLKSKNPELLGNVYNISMSTKALLLSSSVKLKQRILNSGDSLLMSRYQSWIGKKELLSQLYSMNTTQIATSGYDINGLEKEVEDLEKVLSESSELFAENYEKKNTDWRSLRKVLTENEAAVDMIRFRKFERGFTDKVEYAALVATTATKDNPEAIVFDNGDELESKYLKYYRNCMKYNIEDEKSYHNYWEPIKSVIGDRKTVYFSPEGVFNQINLESIPLGNGKYVIDEREIVLLSNMKDLLADKRNAKADKAKQTAKTTNSVALVGNPRYYEDKQGHVKQLPGAEEEVRVISQTFTDKGWTVSTFLFDQAEESKIKKMISPNVFHIATHGFFLEDTKQSDALNELTTDVSQNPLLRSGLILENGGALIEKNDVLDFNTEEGILTAYEAMNLNFDHTELVVLSACETGLGDLMLGEGVYGLQRSFIVAGAHNIIMSLFKVPDQPTMELMSTFYKNWLTTGDKRQAFLDAQRTIRQKYPEPINWGSFVLIGL